MLYDNEGLRYSSFLLADVMFLINCQTTHFSILHFNMFPVVSVETIKWFPTLFLVFVSNGMASSGYNYSNNVTVTVSILGE